MKIWQLQEFSNNTNDELKQLKDKLEQIQPIVDQAIVKNSNNQVANSLKVAKVPSEQQDVVRYEDRKYKRIIHHTSQVSANTVLQWTAPDVQRGLNEFIIKLAAPSVDYLFHWVADINEKSYNNQGPIVKFARTLGAFDETAKAKPFFDQDKFKLLLSIPVSSVTVYWRPLYW